MGSTCGLRERTKAFALRVVKLYRALPHSVDGEVIGKQLLRSATSVGANYRAACRARSRTEFVAKLGIVVEEADEATYWLDLLADSEMAPRHRLEDLIKEANELTSIFTAARKTTRSDREPVNRRS